MNANRVLDAVWRICDELAQYESVAPSVPWSAEKVLREASGCILGSQVPHAMVVAAIERLAERRLLVPTVHTRLHSLIATLLHSPLSRDYPRAYRFPEQAAQRLARLASVARELVDIVLYAEDISAARRDLTALRCGLGAKQASLLLRNVRAGAELAVLDVHLLGFMRIAGLTTAAKVPPLLAKYEDLEDRFRTYASGLRLPMQRLDRAAWIVMRAARIEKEAAWV